MKKYKQDILSVILVAVLVLTSVFTTQQVYAEEVIGSVEEAENENTEKTEETPENIEDTENSENIPSINNEQEENLIEEETQDTEEQTETPTVEETQDTEGTPTVEDTQDTEETPTEETQDTEEETEIQTENPIEEDTVKPIKTDLSEEILAGANAVLEEDDEVVDNFDLSVPEGTEFPISLTFSANVEAGQHIVLLHLAGEEWERIIPDSVEDGQITATFNSLSPIVVLTKTEVEDIEVEPYEQTLEAECGGSVISVVGIMPEGITLTVTQIANIKQIEDALNEDESTPTFVIEEGFDITLYDADRNIWQPMDYDQKVVITITNIEISAPETTEVLRVEEDEITSMTITEVSKDTISFETEHFTQYIIGSLTLDTDNATDHWVVDGNDYYYYIENGQGILMCEGTGTVNPDLDQVSGVGGIDTDYDGTAPIATHVVDIVHISEGFTSIGGALSNCTNLLSVYLPASLTSIGDSAFLNDGNLSNIDISNVTSLGENAFKNCSSIGWTSLPEGITLTGPQVFSGCSNLALTTLPSSITMLMQGVFAGCTTLSTTLTEEVTFNSSITIYESAFAGVPLSLKALTSGDEYLDIPYDTDPADAMTNSEVLSDSVVALTTPPSTGWDISKSSSDHVFAHLSDDGTTLIVEGTGQMMNFSTLNGDDNRPWADSLANITTIIVGSGITTIGDEFGADMPALTSVSLPDGITSIGYYAFSFSNPFGNGVFTTINLPNTITTIEQCAFKNACDVSITTLPTGLRTIGVGAFQNCPSLTVSSLPTGLISIGSRAFLGTSINISTIPSSVTSIGDQAFYICFSLTSIEIAHSCNLGVHVFEMCMNLASADISGLTTIPDSTFVGCSSLANVTFSDSLTTIASSAFMNDSSLAISSFPSGLEVIGANAFANATNLANTLNEVLPFTNCTVGAGAFGGINIDYLRSDTDELINLQDFNGTDMTTTLIKPVTYVVRVPATQAFTIGADDSSLSANITVSVEITGSDELANKQYVELSPSSATADLNADGTKVGEITIAQSKTAFHKSDASNEATTVVTYSQASPFKAGKVITSTVGYTYSLKVDPSGI